MATSAATTIPLEGVTYSPPARQRIDSIDLLRGLVMVIMMLDHTRDYFSAAAFQFDPTDLTKTSVVLFLTRWITHFCAPTFFFLAGTGAYLRRARGATTADMSRFLASRGVWLLFLEFTIVRWGITGDLLPHGTYVGQTIWALGWSMIVLAALVHLPLRVIGAFSVTMILVHNAFDGITANGCGIQQSQCRAGDLLLRLLHESGPILLGGPKGIFFMALYPLIPWIGVMAAGYVFGKLYTLDAATRRRILVRLGAGLIALFVVLRASNLYGDPSEWSVQRSPAFTLLSFLNTTKYPPSLLYLCMTLGPAILLLAFLEREKRGGIGRALVTYGRVPMLYYLLQWLYAHGAAFIAFNVAGKNTQALHVLQNNPPEVLANAGFSLPVVYAFWILGVFLLYPICAKYAAVKAKRREWWWGYL